MAPRYVWTLDDLHALGYRVQDGQAMRTRQETPSPQNESCGTMRGEDIPEGTLLAQVRRCALDNGFVFYHTYRSTRSDPGYLDCTLTKPGHPLYIWELKTKDGKLTREQGTWLTFLRQATRIEAACYRPAEWPLMQHLLTRRTP